MPRVRLAVRQVGEVLRLRSDGLSSSAKSIASCIACATHWRMQASCTRRASASSCSDIMDARMHSSLTELAEVLDYQA